MPPLLVSTRQMPLVPLRTAMSARPSALKSPTVGNCQLMSVRCVAQSVGAAAVPVAGVSVTHQPPLAACAATSVRPSALKSPATVVSQVVPAGRVASGPVAKPVPVERLITSALPVRPTIALGITAGGATVTEKASSTKRVASKTLVARTVTTAVPMPPGA